MKIAKLIDGQLVVNDYWALFPQTSFSADGPNAEFFAEHGCYSVTAFKPHDSATEMLVGCEPYMEGEIVYTVRVEARPQVEETIIITAGNGADSI